jgi:hypothetical protein
VTLPLFERVPEQAAHWIESHKGHRRLIEFADRHYTRQTPGSNQACRPGHNLVLLLSDGSAGWVVWRPNPEVGRKDELEAWECTIFRNEGSRLSSDLILEAVALVHVRWGWPPRDGLITAVGIQETAARRSARARPGQCFRAAGWVEFVHPYPNANQVWLRAPHPVRVAK